MSNLSEKNTDQDNAMGKKEPCNSSCNCTSTNSTEPENKSDCGPECACNCGTPSSNKKMKVVLSLIVLLAVGGILAYKAFNPKQNTPYGITAKDNSGFAVAQTASKAEPKAVSISEKSNDQKTESGKKIGEYLESLKALNNVALNQDTVFIFIPAATSELADEKTNEAVLAAQQTLKAKNITVGLYTLPSTSPDYSAISAQVKSPAILVASKGRGMGAVSGEVTETKLLQAYMASSRAGGCGPSSGGCGPSSKGCN